MPSSCVASTILLPLSKIQKVEKCNVVATGLQVLESLVRFYCYYLKYGEYINIIGVSANGFFTG